MTGSSDGQLKREMTVKKKEKEKEKEREKLWWVINERGWENEKKSILKNTGKKERRIEKKKCNRKETKRNGKNKEK